MLHKSKRYLRAEGPRGCFCDYSQSQRENRWRPGGSSDTQTEVQEERKQLITGRKQPGSRKRKSLHEEHRQQQLFTQRRNQTMEDRQSRTLGSDRSSQLQPRYRRLQGSLKTKKLSSQGFMMYWRRLQKPVTQVLRCLSEVHLYKQVLGL